MKIKDIQDRLPLKIKLNKGFTLDESFDPNTIVLVKNITEDGWDGDPSGRCYKLIVSALKEDMEHNKKVAIPDWNDNDTIYDAPYHKKFYDEDGNFNDTIYVMENDNFFDLVEEKPTTEELLDCIKNLMGVLDTPIAKAKITGEIADEARKIANDILEKYK